MFDFENAFTICIVEKFTIIDRRSPSKGTNSNGETKMERGVEGGRKCFEPINSLLREKNVEPVARWLAG